MAPPLASWSAYSADSAQLQQPLVAFVAHKPKNSIWTHSLLIPAYFAGLSCLYLLLSFVAATSPVRSLRARLSRSDAPITDDAQDEDTGEVHAGFVEETKAHIRKHGGSTIFAFKVLRLVSSLALLACFVITLVLEEEGEIHGKAFTYKRGKKHHRKYYVFTRAEWMQFALAMTSVYASILAIISVAARPALARRVTSHVGWILAAICGVYFYRDVWPLMTFTLQPKDRKEGWLLWTKIGVSTLGGIIVPLFMPRTYIPVDPKNPMTEPNPEQVCSWFSLLVYTFLDGTIFTAYKLPQLKQEHLPPLADYDRAHHLVEKSYPELDTFSGARKRHLFWGLMAVFRREYIALSLLMVFRAVSGFASPLGINKLLEYIETGGEDAVVRPWVWIGWLFLGPLIGSLSMQYYVFINTRTLVRTEGIITQLIFDHALRVRMKAEVADGPASTTPAESVATTPDTASIADTTGTNGDDSGDETLGASSATVSTSAPKKPQTPSVEDDKTHADGSSKADNLIGKINNLVTTDLGNLVDGRDFLFIALYAPLEFGLAVYFLYYFLGWSAFVGLAVMLILFPIPGYFAKRIQTVQVQRMKKTDARVQTVSETMGVLRMIKLFGWEAKINQQVEEKREEELRLVWKRKILDMINNNINYVLPLAHMMATYLTFTLIMKRPLSASLVFSTMSVFDVLRGQLFMLLQGTPMFIQAKVSLDRVNDFLHDTELLDEFAKVDKDTAAVIADPIPVPADAFGFRAATFTWSTDPSGTLTPSRRNFRLRLEDELLFKRGGFNLIIGPTGSGKTSLLMALLGEMHFEPHAPNSWFHLPREGGVAYAAQESWVQNETIRDNIIFGSPFDEARYKKVIYQCGLKRDLSLFDAGDLTEVGEKGLTLSGGQKARITLARAVYSSADIILLDDVLAALDVHTSKWIVDKCFKGDLLRGRTVLLVTHNVAMTSSIADFVVSLGSDGRIRSQGSVSDALAKDRTLVKELNEEKAAIKAAENEVETEDLDEEGEVKKGDGTLIVAEETAEGHVGWPALKLYLSSLGGRWPVAFWAFLIGCFTMVELLNTYQTWFLGHWARQYDLYPPSEVNVPYYLSMYAILLASAVALYMLFFSAYVFGTLRSSRVLHKRLVESVLGTTLRWLDTTPTSRIIARCTQDIRAVDGSIPDQLSGLIDLTFTMLVKLGAVILFTPIFVVPGALLALLGGWCGQIYIKAQLGVKREMSVARAPVLGHFGAAIAGLVSIRAYGAQDRFKLESYHRIDRYTRAARSFYNLNRWVCVRIDALGGLFAAGLAAYLIYGQRLSSSADTGFSITMAVTFSGMILWWVRSLNEFEVAGNSLERIQEYVTISQEPKPTESGTPPAYWPASGDLRIEKLSARYSSDGPKVLHEVSFHIKSGERVGVVGRTGSGKSSLTLSLLRCIFTEGEIYYDGLPISSLNLDALRTNITIIPQVPELLSGSLRQNLDPFSQYDDATLNDALRAAGLFSVQSETDEGKLGLDTLIASGGGNLSVGQRQILALARAIVRQSKLLILDEATSAIDYETDNVIQSSLRRELKSDVTVVTIAHRLDTVIDADKIMVLDAGRLVEFDSPAELLKNEKSFFRSLVDESGAKEKLYELAAAKASQSGSS